MVTQTIEKGYRRTEIGVIPKDWDIVRLSDIGIFKKGRGLKKEELSDEGLPCIRYGEIYTHHNYIVKRYFSFVSSELAKCSQRIAKGDLLFTGSGETAEEIGKCVAFLGDESAYAGGDVIIFTPRNSDSTFLAYLLNHSSIVRQKANMAQGDVIVHIYPKNLGQLLFSIPSEKEEQSVIAKVLYETDDLIELLDKLVEKKRSIKQGAMQELLTGKKRLPGFVDIWETKEIRRIAEVTAGGTPSTFVPEYWGGNIRWMNSGELNLKKIHDVEGRITESGLQNSATQLLPQKCVLIGLAGQGKTRGTVAMNYVELCTNQSIGAILPNDSFVPEYLYYNLDSRYSELRRLSTGEGGRGGLNLSIIRNILVNLPPTKEEQSAIAQVLSDMDSEIEALEQKRDKFKQLKMGMMQQLLTGRIRLKWKN